MHRFAYRQQRLFCEGVSVESLARRYGTPLYVYSATTMEDHALALGRALIPLPHLICYAVKANSNQAVLHTLVRQGCGFDVVSEGELRRVLLAGGDPGQCVFAGVGKTDAEIEFALRQGIYSFNVESEPELERIHRIGRRLGIVAPVAARVNPNVDAHTHAKITTGTYENKFGIALEAIEALYERGSRLRHIRWRGLQMHLGSQLTDTGPFVQAVEKTTSLVHRLKARHPLEFFSLGGGMGIVYQPALESGQAQWWKRPAASKLLNPRAYAASLVPRLEPLGLRILIEPGRFIVGNAGLLVTRVEYVKRTGRKVFVIVDAAMNDLIRPAFYDSYHEIVPLSKKAGPAIRSDVVGPICESGDYFCKDRRLPRLQEGDYLALMSAGAYGFVMASNYNSRPLAAEVMVRGRRSALVRNRQPVEQIWAGESIPQWV